jgi:hypothetical protein
MGSLVIILNVLNGHAILIVILAGALVRLAGPKSQVITQELHDQSRVLVRSLRELVKARDGLIEGRLGELAGGLLVLEDFVEAHRVVEGETETDGVSGIEDLEGDLLSLLVELGGLLLVLLISDELCEITVIVTSHLKIKHSGLVLLNVVLDKGILEKVENIQADIAELRLNLAAISDDEIIELALIDAGVQSSPGGAARTDNILVSNGEKIALLNGKLGIALASEHNELAHDLAHVLITLSGFGGAGHEDKSLALVLATEVLGLKRRNIEGSGDTRHSRRGRE